MALKVVDRVKETTTTTGTGTVNLAGAASGFRTFVAGVGDGNTTYYAITDANGTAWEVGLGTVTDASPDTLARTTLLASSTGSKISLSSGTHTVFATYPGSKAVFTDADGHIVPLSDDAVDLGTSSVEFRNAYFDGTVTSDAFAGPLTGDVTGNADTATTSTNITASANNSTDETVYPTFVDGATGTQGIETDTGLTYNPSTGTFTSTVFVGALTGNASGSSGSCTGNAATATALETARTINGTSFDGTANITITAAGSTLSDTVTVAKGGTGATTLNNLITLGTHTTGNYVATIAGTSNEIEVSGSGSETATITIGLPDDVTIAGDLTVNGDTVTVNTATLSVEDPLIILASGNNAADSVDIGFYGLYDTSGSQDLYAGLFRDANDSGKFKLFKDLQAAPTTTVNVSGTGYAVATLVANIEGDVTGDVTGNADTATLATSFTASANNSTDETVYPVFVDGATGTQGAETDTGFTYNPSSGLLTIAGELDAGSLDISGNADIDGTLEADAYTVDGVALNEYIADTVGAMVGSNTETNITVTYEDGDNTLDFVIGTLNQDTTGTADNITVSANDSTDETVYPIFVDGATGSQGAESDTGFTYNPSSGLLTISGELDAGSLDISGNADIDGTLEADAITVDGVALNEYIADTVGAMVGSNTETNIAVTYEDGDNTLDFVIGTLNQDTTGTADNFTVSANNSTDETVYPVFVDGATGSQGAETDTGLTYNPSSGLLTAAAFSGPLTGNVTGNASGTAATVTGGTQAAITSAANLVTVGTIGTGVWQGTAVALAYGGTGLVGATDGKIVVADGSGAPVAVQAFTANDGTLKHEVGGIEADISGIAVGDILAGTGSGAIGIVTSTGHSDGDVLTLQADGTADWETASSGGMTAFILEDDDGTEVSISNAEEIKFIGSGITTNWTDTTPGSDGDPFDMTFTVDADQTGITSILATDLKIGEDDQTKIDFETADEIHFYAASVEQVYLGDNIFGPQSDSDVDLGTTGVRWKDAFVDSITVTGEIDGASLDISGNADIDGTLEADAITIGGTNVVTGSLITTLGTVSAGVWQGTAIASSYIAADAIDGSKLADNAVNSEHYTDGSIDTAHIGDLQVTTAKIAADAITGAKIADDTIDSEHYAAASIDNEHLADDAVGTAEIADDAITSALIADDAIVSAAIADDAVLTAHIADDQITAALMADNSIDSDMYVDGSIDTAHIADNQVTLAKIATITDERILGRVDNSTATVAELTKAQVLTMLNVADGATASAGTVTSVTAGAGMTQSGTASVNPTLDVVGGDGITANTNDVAITAAQTTITSIYNSSLVVGYGSSDANINFGTDNQITFDIDGTGQAVLKDGMFHPVTDSDVDLGKSDKYWKDAYIDTITTTGTITAGGAVTSNAGIVVDNITIDGTEIDLSSGDLTIDVAADIDLDAGGGNFKFSVGGTQILDIGNSSSDVVIKPVVDAKDIIFQQRDGTEVARIEDDTYLSIAVGIRADAQDGASLGADGYEFSDLWLADGAICYFGDDGDVTLTHVADTGLLLNSTRQIQFNDANEAIYSSGSSLVLKANGVAYTLPTADAGGSGYSLTSNGSGTLSWTNVSGGGGSGDVEAGSSFSTNGVIMAANGTSKTIDVPGTRLTTNSQPMTISASDSVPFRVDASDRDGNCSFEFIAGTGATNHHAILKVIGNTGASSYIYLGDPDDENRGHIRYKNNGDEMIFHVNAANAMTIAAEGDVTFEKAIKPADPAAASGTSGIVVLDCNTTNHFTITTGGNITGWNFTNASVGQRIIVRVTNGASHTVAFSSSGDGDVVYFPGGTEPTLTTSGGIDVYGFLCVASDTFDGFIIGQDIKA